MTATLTETSADDSCGEWVVEVVAGGAEHVAEGVDGLALEAESYVGVHACGDADVGVAEEFLDDDELNALLTGTSLTPSAMHPKGGITYEAFCATANC
ncbi:hypothetical protein H5I60_03290 [Streptomyces griseolus]|nr:hypothetical protein [Streptomyces griseolus]